MISRIATAASLVLALAACGSSNQPSDQPTDTVLSSSPDPGTQVDKGSVVTLTVSSGPAPTTTASTEPPSTTSSSTTSSTQKSTTTTGSTTTTASTPPKP